MMDITGVNGTLDIDKSQLEIQGRNCQSHNVGHMLTDFCVGLLRYQGIISWSSWHYYSLQK